MTPYKTVLIAVDLEGEPEQVLAKAHGLIDPSTDILILHVTFDPSYIYASYTATGGVQKPTSVTVKDQAKVKTLQALEKLLKNSELKKAKKIVEFGHTADLIIASAEQLQADLIIIGSHGRQGVRMLLGSTANAVLHHATCDVLAIRIKEDKE